MPTYFRLFLVMLLAFMPLQGGCKQKPEAKPVPPPLSIGVSVISDGFEMITEPFKKEMQSLAKEKKVRFIWKEAKDSAEQKAQFQEIIKQKPKVILFFSPEKEDAQELAKLAKKEGILLLAIGVLAPDMPADGFVGFDPKQIGEQQGKFLLKNLQDRSNPKVLILTEQQKNHIIEGIIEGNKLALENKKDILIFEKEIPLNDAALALNKIWDELGGIDGLITHNEKSAKAALVSLRGQAFDVLSIGIGASKEMAEAIASGEHQAELDLEPEAMARYVFEAAENLARTGEWDFDTWIDNGPYQIPVKYTPSRIITRENLTLLQVRHGKLKPKPFSDSEQGDGGNSKKQEQENDPKGQQEDKQGSKIKVKLKGGKEMEFQVPDEVESIEIESKEQKGKESKGSGGQGNTGNEKTKTEKK